MIATSNLIRSLALLLIIALLVPVVGCGGSGGKRRSKGVAPSVRRVVFEHEFRSKYSLNNESIKRLQFYISRDIRLHRETSDATPTKVSPDGRLIIKSGKEVEEIEIAEGSPCIATEVTGESMEISFKDGTDTFKFVREGDGYGLAVDDGGIEFDGTRYVPTGSSESALLMIEENVLYDQREKILYLPGRVQNP